MKHIPSITLVFVIFSLIAGCKQSVGPEDEIHTAIQAHLAKKGTLNLQAFETVVKQVSIQGDHAQVQVEYHVKNGPGMMQLTYSLDRRNGKWEVAESNPVGADFSHPALDAAGQSDTPSSAAGSNSAVSDALKHFGVGPAPSPNLPPGHPPVGTGQSAAPR